MTNDGAHIIGRPSNGLNGLHPFTIPPGKEGVALEAALRFQATCNSVLAGRMDFFNRFLSRRDNIDEECSYPDSLTADFYRDLYDRMPIAERVVNLLPKESWQVTPLVYEDEDAENATPFEKGWDELGQAIEPGKSWYQDEQGSLVWSYLQRCDILSGIGVYGVMLIGIDDGRLLEQPADGVDPDGTPKDITGVSELQSKDIYGGDIPRAIEQPFASTMGTDAQYFGVQFSPMQPPGSGKGKERKLTFLRCFDESLVQVVQYEASMYSPRFGQPIMYRITLNDPRVPHTGVGLPLATVRVHWSRVIHFADNLTNSEIFGVPRMRPIINPILDLKKLYGGSAEMYWKGAFMGLSLETVPQLGGDVQVQHEQLDDMMEQYFRGLRRSISLMGMSAKTLSPQVVDPSPQIAAQIEAICIHLGCPVRVFKGSERGELASAQDDSKWNDILRNRQNTYLTPKVIAPFINRLIQLRVLPEPQGYSIEWPDLDSTSKKDKAGIAFQRTQALGAYVSGNLESLLTPKDYLTKFMEFDEEEADVIVEDAKKHQEDNMTMPSGGELGHPATATPPPQPPIIGGPPSSPGAPPLGAGGAAPKPPGMGTPGGPPKPAAGQKPPSTQPGSSPVTHSLHPWYTENAGEWKTLESGQHVYISAGGDFQPDARSAARDKAADKQVGKGQSPLRAGHEGYEDEKSDNDTNVLVAGAKWARKKGVDLQKYAKDSLTKGHSSEDFASRFRGGSDKEKALIKGFYRAYKKRQPTKNELRRMVDNADFDESKHQRDEKGRWTSAADMGEAAANAFNQNVDKVHKDIRDNGLEDYHSDTLQDHVDTFVSRVRGTAGKAWKEVETQVKEKLGDTPAVKSILSSRKEQIKDSLKSLRDVADIRVKNATEQEDRDARQSGRSGVEKTVERIHSDIANSLDFAAKYVQGATRSQEIQEAGKALKKFKDRSPEELTPKSKELLAKFQDSSKWATIKHDPTTSKYEIHTPGESNKGGHFRLADDGDLQLHDNDTKEKTSPTKLEEKRATRNAAEDEPREEKGRWTSGGSSESTSHEEKAKSIVGSLKEKVTAGVKAGVAAAIKGLDEKALGGISVILGGIKAKNPLAVARGVASIVDSIFEYVHTEVFENALSEHSIPGAAVATKGTNLLLKGVGKALKGLTRNELRELGLSEWYIENYELLASSQEE
jgi:hypothetical protein